jgi:phage tail-like protein
MDSNGQRFWMWSQAADWSALQGTAVTLSTNTDAAAHDAAPRPLLSLRAERAAPALIDGAARELLAETELARLPLLRDRFGTLARWDGPSRTLMGFGAFVGEVPRYATSAAAAPLDMALDHEDVLLLSFAERIELVDLRDRFAPIFLNAAEAFVAHALACDTIGGRWALDRTQRRLARIVGTPWPDRAGVRYDAGTFRPGPENPDAPRIERLDVPLPPDLRPVALAASPGGRLAIAHWGPDGALMLQLFDREGHSTGLLQLEGAAYAHALAWLDDGQVVLRIADLAEALAYAVPEGLAEGTRLQPAGRRYPTADAAPGRFVAAQQWPPHVPLAQPPDPDRVGPETAPHFTRELVPLAWRGFVSSGKAEGRTLDSGQLDMAWHRLLLEAIIPAGCGVLVELAASDENLVPADGDWAPHWFGDIGAAPALPLGTPQGCWQAEASELPHRAGVLDCPPQPGRVGLFNVLVQRAGRQLRTLRGRHLWLRLTLHGNGRSTPEVAALRLWGERFSYVRRYLPELYRDEDVFDRSAEGAATPHDFLERFTQLFESVLTPLEDRIADARVLTDPASTPPQWLDWLAGWTAERFPSRLPAQCKRDWLCHAVELRRRRGTLQGLQLALDIATQGQVGLGRILVIEDFRLRRTLATLLGIDLNRTDDALLPGLRVSGNSFVGDTLILGDSQDGPSAGLAGADDAQARREFLALFGESIESEAEAQTVASVYERTAHRATVLVHEGLDEELRARVANVAAELAPAHVLLKVIAAREPFLVGVAGLVGYDSYLRVPLPPQTARIGHSAIGRGDRIRGGGALDWRLEDGVPSSGADSEPAAVLKGPAVQDPSLALTLDGRDSIAPSGGAIVRWRFTRKT